MIIRFRSLIYAKSHSLVAVCGVVSVLQFGALASSAQTGTYLFTGSETNITLNPGLYDITAYGAQGGSNNRRSARGGLGAEMRAEFNFTTTTTLTLLVGVGGGGIGVGGSGLLAGGGGGGSFVVSGTTPVVIAAGGGGASPGQYAIGNGGNGLVGPGGGDGGGGGGTGGSSGSGGAWGVYRGGGGGGYSGDATGFYGGTSFLSGGSPGTIFVSGGYGGGGGGGASGSTGGGGGGGYSGGGGGGGDYLNGAPGGGGGSYIDSSAVAVLTEVSGVASPDGSRNGEIIITAISQPGTLNYQVIDGKLVLDWAQGTLLSAGTLNGTYTPVSGASSPYTNSMTGPQQYFRVIIGAN